MKTFDSLICETIEAEDIDELESAADLFQFGIEKGYYDKKQADEFNNTYWKIKTNFLANEISKKVKMNRLDITYIISNAPVDIKNDINSLTDYVFKRVKSLKGKIGGIK
ncbi:hypothetical protein IRP63_06715 [Clostridium botulinum]|uniref:Uncharacterized protein n=1 Tax=Clostridium botulinum C/D str. DC5 TaxID=1443128 RepID=A0A0A0IHX1_CLOBO|nr:hypothetical protein [Clostridium botulinum]KEI04392.1 hypothetical protein Z952_06900 [Clostridium botulinum C/D str. BKT75002]KEI11301.1 hypothetical protein Z954_08380 [Clostridium botulinum C/D str. BKT2873]KGM97420.1 hypothetical protein Z956_01350 [Clostridium botulinum D str. CCUG 7971]KGM99160.1 hypothetical protein Z955_08560 [Clostridium botulinum C/D str. DC5]KOC46070.1 hypothetical protein ADU88_12515 [Clostridium botulinum]